MLETIAADYPDLEMFGVVDTSLTTARARRISALSWALWGLLGDGPRDQAQVAFSLLITSLGVEPTVSAGMGGHPVHIRAFDSIYSRPNVSFMAAAARPAGRNGQTPGNVSTLRPCSARVMWFTSRDFTRLALIKPADSSSGSAGAVRWSALAVRGSDGLRRIGRARVG